MRKTGAAQDRHTQTLRPASAPHSVQRTFRKTPRYLCHLSPPEKAYPAQLSVLAPVASPGYPAAERAGGGQTP